MLEKQWGAAYQMLPVIWHSLPQKPSWRKPRWAIGDTYCKVSQRGSTPAPLSVITLNNRCDSFLYFSLCFSFLSLSPSLSFCKRSFQLICSPATLCPRAELLGHLSWTWRTHFSSVLCSLCGGLGYKLLPGNKPLTVQQMPDLQALPHRKEKQGGMMGFMTQL